MAAERASQVLHPESDVAVVTLELGDGYRQVIDFGLPGVVRLRSTNLRR